MRMASEAYDDAVFDCCGYDEQDGNDKDGYCQFCEGSGEGRHDGSTCSQCNGKG